jgi:pimeloyl-ACP methyl ester carboxylesterase
MRNEEITLHGHRVAYATAGEGPPLVLIHGITSSSDTWTDVIPLLAEHHTVIAPDLIGHGRSAKPRGDYSLGAYASGIRDLIVALGHDRVTIVGHSLGGGIAMQFAYQFPERIERLVLVASGGLGRGVHLALRSAALPGAELVLPLLGAAQLHRVGGAVGRVAGALGFQSGPDLREISAGLASFGDWEARRAFVHTVRGIIEPGGQRVNASDRLYLAEDVPTMIVWGENDPIIPVRHGRRAHDLIRGSRLEVFPDAGHFPHGTDPYRFARVLREFVDTTEPAEVDLQRARERLITGAPA